MILLKGGAHEDEPPGDTELCRAFLEGDTQAFGELVRRHQDAVFRLVRRYTTHSDDVLDLSQRAFLQAFQAARRALPHLQKAAGAEVPFRAWLLRIAINLAKNHSRQARRWKLAPVESLDSSNRSSPLNEPLAHAALERAEAMQMTRAAVLMLPKRQREVFTLRIDAGLHFGEIARTLGITEANAKTHFHYATKRLKAEVQAMLTPPGAPS